MTASSAYSADSGAAKAVDGSCLDSGRWMSAESDTPPVTTAAVDQLRLTITDPSTTTPDIARVYEVAAH